MGPIIPWIRSIEVFLQIEKGMDARMSRQAPVTPRFNPLKISINAKNNAATCEI
jgi:hypothetical protein